MRELERFQTGNSEDLRASAPASPVLTADEAARWLRLDDGADPATARRSLFKLVTDGRLKALSIGRRRLFTVVELTRFVAAETRVSATEADVQEPQ